MKTLTVIDCVFKSANVCKIYLFHGNAAPTNVFHYSYQLIESGEWGKGYTVLELLHLYIFRACIINVGIQTLAPKSSC